MNSEQSVVQTASLDADAVDAHERVREEYERLSDEYAVMCHKARRLGDMMCEIGLALKHGPELIVVRPSRLETLPASAIVLTTHPPTLLAIERLASDIRAVTDRLTELKQRLGENPE